MKLPIEKFYDEMFKEDEVGYELKDSGERIEYNSGALRDITTNKGRFDLISPIFLKRLAVVCEKGGRKYSDRNWEKGMPLMRFIDSAERHINDHKEGKRDEDHIVQAAWNLHCFCHTLEMIKRGILPKELDDRPNYMKEKECI